MGYPISSQKGFSYDKVSGQRKVCGAHKHTEHELYYLLNGDTKYFIGNEFFHLQPGNFIFVPKGAIHRTDSETCYFNERLLFSFGDEIFDDAMKPILEELSRIKLIRISKKHLPSADDLVEKISSEHQSEKPFKEQMIQSYLRILLVRLCRYNITDSPNPDEADQIFYNISEYISNNLSSEITLSSLSKSFSISESHLSRKFKSIFGIGISEYVRYMRMQKAIKLLIGTNLSISEISERCGFNDSNYFSTIFKQTMGVSPHKYRKSNR